MDEPDPPSKRMAELPRDVEENDVEWQRAGGSTAAADAPEEPVPAPGVPPPSPPAEDGAELSRENEDEDQEWRRAGGGTPGPETDGPAAGR